MARDAEQSDATNRGSVCLGCGTFTPDYPATGTCTSCGHPLLRRDSRKRLSLGRIDSEGEARAISLPPEVQQAAGDPKNLFATKYVLVRRIGSGGMGHVYQAWELPLSRYVAIKFLKALSPDDVARFEREAQLAAALDHPNIIPIYEFGQSEGQHFLTMKFIDGRPLDGAPLDERQLVAVMTSVCRAVHSANEAGVIHRDLKPANVMLTAEGRPIVLDFGLAKTVEGSIEVSVSGMVVGTPGYMPPEQAMGQKDGIDRRSDVYSLGATLYAMVAGRPPFEADSPMEILMKVIRDEAEPPRRWNPAVSPALETIILKALEKEPQRRYATAAELADDLERLTSGQSILARPSRRRWIPRFIRRNPLAVAGVLAMVVVMAAYVRSRTQEPTRSLWREQFLEAREGMDPGDAGNDDRIRKLDGLMKEAGANLGANAEDVRQWFEGRSRAGSDALQKLEDQGRAAWPSLRDNATQLKRWAAGIGSLLGPLPDAFRPLWDKFRELENRADRIATFPGLVTLHINVSPYACIDSMIVGSKSFISAGKVVDPSRGTPSSPNLTSPVVIENLELDSCELELVNPELGKRKFLIDKSTLQHGRKYIVAGQMSPGKPIELIQAP